VEDVTAVRCLQYPQATNDFSAKGGQIMLVATDRLLYIVAEQGLFEAMPRGSEYEVKPLPLE
jgi:hypothetical protein